MQAIEPAPDLEQLFRETAEDLSRYFARRHEEAGAAQDLVQETFLQMAGGLRRGKRPRHLRAYLFGIARHVSQAAWSRRRQEREFVAAEFAVEEVAAPSGDERVAAACELIEALPELHREVLDLRFSQGLSYAEIAEALEIPVGTVRSRLHHAVAKVRERLAADDPPPPGAAAPARPPESP